MVAFTMAHTCPLWYQSIARSLRPDRRFTLQRVLKGAVAVWVQGIVAVGLVVNWRSERWSKLHADVVKALYAHTDPEQPILADVPADREIPERTEWTADGFGSGSRGQRQSAEVHRDQIRQLIGRNKTIQIVLFWPGWTANTGSKKSRLDQAFIQGLTAQRTSSSSSSKCFLA